MQAVAKVTTSGVAKAMRWGGLAAGQETGEAEAQGSQSLAVVEGVLCFFVALLVIVLSPMAFADSEFHTYESFANTLSRTIPYITSFMLAVYIFATGIKKESLPFLAVPIVYFAMLVFNTYGGYKGAYLLAFMELSCFMLLGKRMQAKCFRSFYWMVQCLNLVAVVLYLVYHLGGKGLFSAAPVYFTQNPRRVDDFYIRFGAFAMIPYYGWNRMCSVFNEPGAEGTVCALLFAITFDKSSIWEKALLLLSGFLSMSFAFFILLFLFFGGYFVLKDIRFAPFVLLLVLLFLWIPNIKFKNGGLATTAKRFSITDEGLEGDNRTSERMDRAFESFLQSDNLFFGNGYGSTKGYSQHSLSIKVQICEFGVLGIGLYLLLWGVLGFSLFPDWQGLLYIFMYLVSLYQRPYIGNMFCYLLFFGALAWAGRGSGFALSSTKEAASF